MSEEQIKRIFDDSRFGPETVLQTLLAALRQTCAHQHFAAAEHVERAVYKLRESERDNLLYALQREARNAEAHRLAEVQAPQ